MKLLRINEVAKVLNVSRDRAYALARAGILPVVFMGCQVRVDEEKLKEWIQNGGQQIKK